MKTGTVRWFNPQKGYGYIHPDDGSPNVFVNVSSLEQSGLKCLREGQRIGFEVLVDKEIHRLFAVSLAELKLDPIRPGGQLSSRRSNSASTTGRRPIIGNPVDAIFDMVSAALLTHLRLSKQ